MTAKKQILMIVTNHDRIDAEHATGLWFEEFAVPYRLFLSAGCRVTVASPKGGRAPIDPRSAPDASQSATHAEALQALADTRVLSDLRSEDFDAVFIPGGHGTMYDLPVAKVGRVVGEFADAGKIVAAVCHGPAALVAAKRADGTAVVKGRKVTGFTNEEERAAQLDRLMPFLLETRLRDLGAEYVLAAPWSNHVVVDGGLITGQNPQSSADAARAVIIALATRRG